MEGFEILAGFHFVNDFWAWMLPLALMLADFLTGTVNAWIKGEVESSKMREGLAKKFGEIAVIVLTNLMCYALQLTRHVCTAVSLYIVVMELISVFENFDKLGVPIPKFIKSALAGFTDKINNDEDADDILDKLKDKEKDDAE